MGQEISNLPVIFKEGTYKYSDIERFIEKTPQLEVVDIFNEQLGELYEIQNPLTDKQPRPKMKQDTNLGTWVFFPWSNKLVHMLNEKDYLELLANRNQYLVNKHEAAKLKKITIAIFGLSVGNAIARSMGHSGVGRKLVLIDKDQFSTTNMNRVSIKLTDIGRHKTLVTLQQILEVNPFANLEPIYRAFDKQDLVRLIKKEKDLIIFDEIDDFEMKVAIRLEAKKYRVPVIMLTSLGDNVLIDIERHDQEPKVPIFNGRLPKETLKKILQNKLSEKEIRSMAAKIVGIENVPTRALFSLTEVGKTLVGRPQLYSSVSISCGLSVYLVKRIGLHQSLSSGRYLLSLSEVFKLGRKDLEFNKKRLSILKDLQGN